MNSPTMLVPCSVGGWRRICFATRPDGGTSWWFLTEHPSGDLPTARDMVIIGRLVEREVERRQERWRKAQRQRRGAAA